MNKAIIIQGVALIFILTSCTQFTGQKAMIPQDSASLTKTSYIFAANSRIAALNPSGLSFSVHDSLGTESIETDNGGNIISTFTNLPFGELLKKTGNNDFLYTGKEFDETDVYYYGARFYQADVGKFVSVDPSLKILNNFAYVENNPLTKTDPDGRDSFFEVSFLHHGPATYAQAQLAFFRERILPYLKQSQEFSSESELNKIEERVSTLDILFTNKPYVSAIGNIPGGQYNSNAKHDYLFENENEFIQIAKDPYKEFIRGIFEKFGVDMTSPDVYTFERVPTIIVNAVQDPPFNNYDVDVAATLYHELLHGVLREQDYDIPDRKKNAPDFMHWIINGKVGNLLYRITKTSSPSELNYYMKDNYGHYGDFNVLRALESNTFEEYQQAIKE